MKIFLLIICSLVLLISCSVKHFNSEFIEFNHMNAVVIGGDKLTIRLIPTYKNRRKPVTVKIFRKREYFDNKRISYEEYRQISDIILKIRQEELELPKKQNYVIGIVDGGSNSLYLKKDNTEEKFHTYGISKDYNGKFYEATELILKSAKLEMKDVN